MAIISDKLLDTIDLLDDKERTDILEAIMAVKNDPDYANEYFSMGVRNSKPRQAYEKACDKILELFRNPYVYQSKE